ncbi:MAG: FAD-binding oxidoreductase [Alphaproteobacteria bacterium]|nr:FAD-binding oxidoreductase [Alphaproteobacteria bacterium]
MRARHMKLSGWGRALAVSVRAWRPERAAGVAHALRAGRDDGVIAYAGGRSYGDTPLNGGGDVILTARLDRILSADWKAGRVVCEPGVEVGDLMRVVQTHGYAVPVSPGTGFATVGGCIANDVHGKNHDRHGSFGDHVDWIDLMLPDGETRRVTPDGEADLFAATVGGIGLTGIMLAAGLRLRPVKSNAVLMKETPARDLEAFLAMQEEARDRHTYVVGWIDATARGRALGRGILETADDSEIAVDAPVRTRRRMPIEMPGFAMNRLSVGIFNALYYHRVPRRGRERHAPLTQFLYPLDAIEDWNLLYGKRGFHQFQCVLPDAESPTGLRKLMEAISAAGTGSFLAVLKTLGGAGKGHLSFPMRGFTLALDFPAKPGVTELLGRLERITLDHGGRIYLAKDAAMQPDSFAAMYPRLDEFRAVLDRIDPDRVMNSDMARRLKIRG